MRQTIQQSYLLKLWYKPFVSMQGLIASGRKDGYSYKQAQCVSLVVAACFGVIQSLPLMGPQSGSYFWLLPVAALIGLAGVYWMAWLVRNFGRWFGAAADLRDLRTALGLGLMPWSAVFCLLFLFIQSSRQVESVQGFFLLFFAGFIYGFVILLLCLRAALEVSVVKTFMCIMIAFAVSIFPFTFIIQVLLQSIH